MEGDGVRGEEARLRDLARGRVLEEHRELVVNRVVSQDGEVGDAHLGIVLDTVTPQSINSSYTLRQCFIQVAGGFSATRRSSRQEVVIERS